MRDVTLGSFVRRRRKLIRLVLIPLLLLALLFLAWKAMSLGAGPAPRMYALALVGEAMAESNPPRLSPTDMCRMAAALRGLWELRGIDIDTDDRSSVRADKARMDEINKRYNCPSNEPKKSSETFLERIL